MSQPPQRRGAGLVLALLAGATFGTSGTFATSLQDVGWSPGAAVTWRVGIAAIVLTPLALIQLRGQWHVLRRGAGMIVAYGTIAVAGCQLFYFNAVSHLSVSVALLLEYLGIVLLVGWLWIRHGQRPRRLTVLGAVAALVGLVFVLDLAGSHRLSAVGVLWGLGAAVGLALYYVLSADDEAPVPPLILAWAGMCVGALMLVVLAMVRALPFKAPRTDVTLFHRQTSWLVPVLLLALVAAALAYVAGIGAARLLGPKLSSFLGLSEVLFAVLFAWLLLGQQPTSMQAVGGIFIIAGVALVRIDEFRSPAGSDTPISESSSPVQRSEPVAVARRGPR